MGKGKVDGGGTPGWLGSNPLPTYLGRGMRVLPPPKGGGQRPHSVGLAGGGILKCPFPRGGMPSRPHPSGLERGSSLLTSPGGHSVFPYQETGQEAGFQRGREAIHIGGKYPALSCNIGKLNIPKIFNQILGTTYNTSADVSTDSNAQ